MPKIPMKRITKKRLREAIDKAGSLVALAAILGKHRGSIYAYLAKRQAPAGVVDSINSYIDRDA